MNAITQQSSLTEDIIIKQFNRIKTLWINLLHVKWSKDHFKLLGPLAENLEKIARFYNRNGLAELALKFNKHIIADFSSNDFLDDNQQLILTSILDEMSRLLVANGELTDKTVALESGVVDQQTVLLLDSSESVKRIIAKLEINGLQVLHPKTIEEAQIALLQTKPLAVIVDTDFAIDESKGIAIIEALRGMMDIKAPIIFMSSYGDFSTRLQAIRAGCSGFFVKPINVYALLDKLHDLVFQKSLQGYRVLIVDPHPSRLIPHALNIKGIMSQTLTKSFHVIRALNEFHPDLLLLNIQINDVINDEELIQIVRQTEGFENLPIVAYSVQEKNRLAVELGVDDFIPKSVSIESLLDIVTRRLKRTRNLHQKLGQLYLKDFISGLYNRQFFLDELMRAFAVVDQNRAVSVVLIMLDNLRELRDQNNVLVADGVVEQAASRLQACLGTCYRAARFGEAMFAVMMDTVEQTYLVKIAQNIQHELERAAYVVGEHSVSLRCCIGISTASSDDTDFTVMIQQADLACSLAREAKNGHPRVYIYQPKTDNEAQKAHREKYLDIVQEAVDNQRLRLVFQPIVNLHGDRVARYEVFLRIQDQQGMELLPEVAFEVTQNHRVGVLLDRWVIEHAIDLLRQYQYHSFYSTTQFFINVCEIIQAENATLWLKNCLDYANLPPETLVFEIAEAAVMEHPRETERFIKHVKNVGCGVLVQHFGQQQDSHALLEKMPFDYVKLHSGFTTELMDSQQQQEALRGWIATLAPRGQQVIVSSVEHASMLPVLWSCGVQFVQGFFLQPPRESMDYDFSHFNV